MPTRRSRYLLLLAVLSLALGTFCAAEEHKNSSAAEYVNASVAITTTSPVTLQSRFVGLYAADGNYKSPEANARSFTKGRESVEELRLRSAAVPSFVSRPTSETVVEDLAPPSRSKRAIKGKSGFASLRDSIINAVYGSEQVLRSPTLVAIDSHQRLIVSDPVEPAVHILAANNSFRIQGGRNHRLLHPVGIAVDSQDNIYVSDAQIGAILVYDSDGRFLRQLGISHGESMFEAPTSIAVDRTTDLLYVLDSPLNEIVVLDRAGRAVKRIGGIHSRNTSVKFDLPSAIAVGNGAIVVLDTLNSRVLVLDLDGKFRNEFSVRALRVPPVQVPVGLALDNAGNIYTSHLEDFTVRIYKQNGELIETLRSPDLPSTRLTSPSGICVDFDNRIFVADPRSSSIQVFQMWTEAVAPELSGALHIR